MEAVMWGYYLGLLVFALNGIIFMAQWRKIDSFNYKADKIEGLLQKIKVRRRNIR